jgi:hypothetical protein
MFGAPFAALFAFETKGGCFFFFFVLTFGACFLSPLPIARPMRPPPPPPPVPALRLPIAARCVETAQPTGR